MIYAKKKFSAFQQKLSNTVKEIETFPRSVKFFYIVKSSKFSLERKIKEVET